jgi:serine/threonine protein kinase
MKPDNVKVMPEDAAWPHKLVDFSESKLGKATMSGSVTGTIGYNAPEIYGGGIADQSADFYSLMRIAAHMLIGDNKKFMATWFGNNSVRDMKEEGDLNVSEQFLTAIERATSKDPSHRYKTLAELAKDLGYNLSNVPQTRGELEAILGHKSLVPRVEIYPTPKVSVSAEINPTRQKQLEMQVKIGSSDLPAVVDNRDGTITIGKIKVDIGKSPYETARNLRLKVREQLEKYSRVPRGSGLTKQDLIEKGYLPTDDELNRIENSLEAYFQHISPQFPILQEALAEGEGRKTLEDVLGEKGPSFRKNIVKRMKDWSDYLLPIKHIKELTPEVFTAYHPLKDLSLIFSNALKSHKIAKEAHLARRKQLYELVGAKEKDFIFLNGKFIVGYLSGMFGSLAPALYLQAPFLSIPSTALGAIIGSNIGRSRATRKLSSKLHELSSWIAEGRRAQNPLERMAEEESVELTGGEYVKISDRSWGVGAVVSGALGGISVLAGLEPFVTISVALGTGTISGLGNYFALKERKLREKREAAMQKYGELTILENTSSSKRSKRILKNLGLTKPWFKDKFFGEGVKVEYSTKFRHLNLIEGNYITQVTISATDERKARHVYDALSHNTLVENSRFSPDSQPKQIGVNTTGLQDLIKMNNQRELERMKKNS